MQRLFHASDGAASVTCCAQRVTCYGLRAGGASAKTPRVSMAWDVHQELDMNASNTMVRKATELDVGSKVVYEGEIKTVAAIAEVSWPGRVMTTMRFTDGTSTMERASALFVCV